MIADPIAIDDTMKLQQGNSQVLKVVYKMQNFLSCEIEFLENKKKSWLGQPYLYDILEKVGKLVMGNK